MNEKKKTRFKKIVGSEWEEDQVATLLLSVVGL